MSNIFNLNVIQMYNFFTVKTLFFLNVFQYPYTVALAQPIVFWAGNIWLFDHLEKMERFWNLSENNPFLQFHWQR